MYWSKTDLKATFMKCDIFNVRRHKSEENKIKINKLK